MNTAKRIGIVVALAAAVAVAVMLKQNKEQKAMEAQNQTPVAASVAPATEAGQAVPNPATAGEPLPRLLDLGATKCIPCKLMAPILKDLKKTYAGKLQVDFIDVWENPDAARQHNINVIPTQIFFAPDGWELFRHEGFFGKEDILNQWKALGYALAATEMQNAQDQAAPPQ